MRNGAANGHRAGGARGTTGTRTVLSVVPRATSLLRSKSGAQTNRMRHLFLTPPFSALFVQDGGEIPFTLDASGRALRLHAADAEPSAAHMPDTNDQSTARAAPILPSALPSVGVMNHAEQGLGAGCARRIGKSSDPDHPFHPCDNVDSDDPVVEALLDSSSNHTRSSSRTR
eukprot:1321948-Pleurochrysis_carterae.AAC.1